MKRFILNFYLYVSLVYTISALMLFVYVITLVVEEAVVEISIKSNLLLMPDSL